MEKEHHVPQDKQLLVHAGDFVVAGTAADRRPADSARHSAHQRRGRPAPLPAQGGSGRLSSAECDDQRQSTSRSSSARCSARSASTTRAIRAFTPYEVVDKYRFRQENKRLAQGVKVVDPGETEFAVNQVVPRDEFSTQERSRRSRRRRARQGPQAPAGDRQDAPARASPRASLQSESFISAASFPGDHQGPHPGLACRPDRRAHRPQGKRHPRSPDPGRHRLRPIPGCRAGVQGRSGRPRRARPHRAARRQHSSAKPAAPAVAHALDRNGRRPQQPVARRRRPQRTARNGWHGLAPLGRGWHARFGSSRAC